MARTPVFVLITLVVACLVHANAVQLPHHQLNTKTQAQFQARTLQPVLVETNSTSTTNQTNSNAQGKKGFFDTKKDIAVALLTKCYSYQWEYAFDEVQRLKGSIPVGTHIL
jgi:hypothetical protein